MTRLFATVIIVSFLFSPAKAETPKSFILVGVGLTDARNCGYKVNESVAAAYIRRGAGKNSFSSEELTQAMVSVMNAEVVTAFIGGFPKGGAEYERMCANILGQFGMNGTVVPGLLSK